MSKCYFATRRGGTLFCTCFGLISIGKAFIAYFYELSLRKLLGVSLIGIKKETGSQCSISVLEVSQC